MRLQSAHNTQPIGPYRENQCATVKSFRVHGIRPCLNHLAAYQGARRHSQLGHDRQRGQVTRRSDTISGPTQLNVCQGSSP